MLWVGVRGGTEEKKFQIVSQVIAIRTKKMNLFQMTSQWNLDPLSEIPQIVLVFEWHFLYEKLGEKTGIWNPDVSGFQTVKNRTVMVRLSDTIWNPD